MADRTNGANNIDIGSGRRGFRNRNLGLGQAGTIVDAEWANGLQEEIVRAIELLGLTPSPSNREQLIQAMRRLSGGNITSLTANATLTADSAGLVLVSAASGNVAITLAAANAAGGAPQRLTFVRTDTSANTVTIQRAGSDTIEGLTSLPLTPGARVRLVSDGASAWRLDGQPLLRGMQAFAGSGSFVVPAGVLLVRARAWGGGGGGGGTLGTPSAGGGGGGGGYGEGIYAVTPGASITVTIGAGGAGGAAGANNGSPGGTTSFGALLSALGGSGGNGANGAGTVGGSGGGATGGTINLAVGPGGNGIIIGGGGYGGPGGGSFGVPQTQLGIGGTGGPGNSPGGGGQGSANGTFGGGAGQAGLVIVEW